ncbi:tetratricopeptide repeat protein [uncultured Microscilla sp.]|uniref:tetratricopeptide repeat protein n=1 Tax=uncultured Microscilla sp. TaxID=432653 RepID=UPI00262C87B4|nr:tetratricopeptide repeat protein [uncultured Microscilla sp.]
MPNLPHIDQLNEQIAQDADNDEAHFMRAEYYFRHRSYAQAKLDYQAATDINPEYGLAYVALGYVDTIEGSSETACAYFEQARLLYPTNSQEAAWVQQVIWATQNLATYGEDASYYNRRGINLNDLKLYWQALVDYSQALVTDPGYKYSYYNRGLNYNEMGEYALAIKDFTQAIRLKPDDPWHYNDRGNSYNYLKRYEEALKDYFKGISIDPNIAALYGNVGDVYFSLGNLEQATHYIELAINKDPHDATYKATLAEIYLCAGDYEKAWQMVMRNRTLFDQSEYALASDILQLVLACILGHTQAINALEQRLYIAKQLAETVDWDFDSLMRWFNNTQDLSKDTRADIRKYLEVAVGLGYIA